MCNIPFTKNEAPLNAVGGGDWWKLAESVIRHGVTITCSSSRVYYTRQAGQSTQTTTSIIITLSSKSVAMSDDTSTSPEVMLQFYRMLYPFKSIFTWLNHEHTPTRLFTHREFAFTIQGDVYLRYHSFNTAEDLKKQVCALNPTRFEIGPMYSAKASIVL